MSSFNYIYIDDLKPCIPATPIYFVNFQEPEYTAINDCGILDTGSDVTIVPMEIVLSINARSIKGRDLADVKLLGQVVKGVPFFLKLSFDNKTFVKTKVFAVSNIFLNGEVIIGRDILNKYVITFNGPKLVFTISN